MKKSVLLLTVCLIGLLSSCSDVPEPEPAELSETLPEPERINVLESYPLTNSLYVISGEGRDDREYKVAGGRLVFPKGTVTKVKGSTAGTPERQFAISEAEIGEIIAAIEKDAVAGDGTDILPELSPLNWEDGWGILYIDIETAIGEENGIFLSFSAGSPVFGGLTDSYGIDFGIDSPELAQKLRDIVRYKTADLKMLDRAVSAKCTSVFNENTLTFTGDELRQLVDGIQTAEKVLATKRAEAVSVEFLLDDGEVVHALFTGTGYSTVGVEAELYEMSEETARPFLTAFKENHMPLFANEEAIPVVSLDCREVRQIYYTDDSIRDDEFFLSYAGAANYDSVIRLGGKQRDYQNIVHRDGKMLLPEGMVVNTTVNRPDEGKELAIISEDAVHEFIHLLESSEAFEGEIPAINSDELNVVILNTAGEYTLLLFSIGNDGFVNCRVLSENKQDNAMDFQVESEKLYETIFSLVRE